MSVKPDSFDPFKFHVDWDALARGWNPFAKRAALDPRLLAQAISEVMARCTLRNADGSRLVWNRYDLIVEPGARDHLRGLERLIASQLPASVEQARAKLKAATVGPFVIHILPDEGGTLTSKEAVVRVRCEAENDAGDPEGALTIRFSRKSKGAPGPAALPEGSAVRVSWPQGEAVVLEGQRVTFGRAHENPPATFIALKGATGKINSRQVWIELSSGRVSVGRISDANPVEVEGREVQPGGHIQVARLPVAITLSLGEMTLRVEG